MLLRHLITDIPKTAEAMNVSYKTVYTWVKNNKVPPKRVFHLANALDVEIPTLLPFADRAKADNRAILKSADDLGEINRCYLDPDLERSKSCKHVLATWGDRWPLLYTTLLQLKAREIGVSQAADRLQITVSAVHNLRRRYGLQPGRVAKVAPVKMKKKDLAFDNVFDVIAGRETARSAAEKAVVSLRSLHRYIESLIDPRTLNELSHWSRNFRTAFALERIGKSQKVVEIWRKNAENRGLLLKKRPIFPKTVENWRETPLWRLTVAVLTGEQDIDTIAVMRGGDAAVLDHLVTKYLLDAGLSCRNLSIHHQAAAAEVIVAAQSHYRRVE